MCMVFVCRHDDSFHILNVRQRHTYITTLALIRLCPQPYPNYDFIETGVPLELTCHAAWNKEKLEGVIWILARRLQRRMTYKVI